MVDSVALLRRKVEDTSLAVQDGTMNSVITLAAIEVRPSLEPPVSIPYIFRSSRLHFAALSLARAILRLAKCMLTV
jgi:hypothetical protein